MAHTETMLESKEIFSGRVIRVTVDKVQLEDGTTSTREIVHHHGGACILPVDADGNVTMVRQFRYAFGEEIWELPAGKLEAGEDPFEAAKRELSEECGLTADNFIDLGVVYATVGYDSEKIYLWAATGLHEVKQHLDAGEFLDVVKMPFDKALGLVGTITKVDPRVLRTLLEGGFLPVVSPVSRGEDGGALNCNADDAARAVAEAVGADKLIFLTDTDGILVDSHNQSTRIAKMDVSRAKELMDSGLIAGGMIPKTLNCIHAVEHGVGSVTVLDGRMEHAILLEAISEKSLGTTMEKKR